MVRFRLNIYLQDYIGDVIFSECIISGGPELVMALLIFRLNWCVYHKTHSDCARTQRNKV